MEHSHYQATARDQSIAMSERLTVDEKYFLQDAVRPAFTRCNAPIQMVCNGSTKHMILGMQFDIRPNRGILTMWMSMGMTQERTDP